MSETKSDIEHISDAMTQELKKYLIDQTRGTCFMNSERRPIAGYEGLYEIDRNGRVYSLERKRDLSDLKQYQGQEKFVMVPETILKYNLNSRGYLRVSLWKNSRRKQHLVHVLVAQTFIPNPHNYPLVNHKDENKQNPCDWNLEWATHSYNVTYSKNREEEPQYTTEVPDLPAMSWV